MNDSIRQVNRRHVVAAGLALGTLSAMSSVPKTSKLSGTVTYRERMALPPDAVLDVKLVDISRADAPADVIAQTSIPRPGTPAHFEVTYAPERIEAGHRYALQARITAGDRLLFISDTSYPVFTGGPDTTDIVVTRVSSGPTPAKSPIGRWVAETIGDSPVSDGIRSTLDIDGNGTAGGTGGCNGFRGSVMIDGETIAFSGIASTMMACDRAAMDQERRFFAALGNSRSFRLEGDPAQLVLLDGTGTVVAALRPA